MQHTIYITIDSGNYNWNIQGHLNGNPLQVDNNRLIFCSEINETNLLEINFDGKNPLNFPDMYVKIQSMIFDYIDVSPTLWTATHYTQHPDWPQISPCTDININGKWALTFSENIVKENIKKYLGLNNE